MYIFVVRAKKDHNNNIIMSLARPCHHCTHKLVSMEKVFKRRYKSVNVKVSFSIDTHRLSRWLTPNELWNYDNSSPIITFGNMSSVFSKIHSWLTIKPHYVQKILTGEKKVENRPPKPKRGSWLKAPVPNKKVLLGVIEGANKKLKIGSRIVAILIVSCIAKDASCIVIHKIIKVAPYYCKGFPGFISNTMIDKYM